MDKILFSSDAAAAAVVVVVVAWLTVADDDDAFTKPHILLVSPCCLLQAYVDELRSENVEAELEPEEEDSRYTA